MDVSARSRPHEENHSKEIIHHPTGIVVPPCVPRLSISAELGVVGRCGGRFAAMKLCRVPCRGANDRPLVLATVPVRPWGYIIVPPVHAVASDHRPSSRVVSVR